MSGFKKWAIWLGVLTLILLGVYLFFKIARGDTRNNIKNTLEYEFFDGDFEITFANGSTKQSWTVTDGKVTSLPDKGYYRFFADCGPGGKQKCKAQSPIGMTFFTELKQ